MSIHHTPYPPNLLLPGQFHWYKLTRVQTPHAIHHIWLKTQHSELVHICFLSRLLQPETGLSQLWEGVHRVCGILAKTTPTMTQFTDVARVAVNLTIYYHWFLYVSLRLLHNDSLLLFVAHIFLRLASLGGGPQAHVHTYERHEMQINKCSLSSPTRDQQLESRK